MCETCGCNLTDGNRHLAERPHHDHGTTAVEVLKELLGLGDSLDGTLLIYDALRVRFHRIRIGKDPECPGCGVRALATHP